MWECNRLRDLVSNARDHKSEEAWNGLERWQRAAVRTYKSLPAQIRRSVQLVSNLPLWVAQDHLK